MTIYVLAWEPLKQFLIQCMRIIKRFVVEIKMNPKVLVYREGRSMIPAYKAIDPIPLSGALENEPGVLVCL